MGIHTADAIVLRRYPYRETSVLVTCLTDRFGKIKGLVKGLRVPVSRHRSAMEPLTLELAQSLGLRDTRGALITRVERDGPAAAAGLAPNDVVVTFDGTAVDDYHHLQRLSAEADVGKTVKLEIVRTRERRSVELKVAEAPDRGPSEGPPARRPR